MEGASESGEICLRYAGVKRGLLGPAAGHEKRDQAEEVSTYGRLEKARDSASRGKGKIRRDQGRGGPECRRIDLLSAESALETARAA